MQCSRETKVLNIMCIIFVALAGITRFISYNYEKFCHNTITLILFSSAIFIWIFQLQRRLLQVHVRRNLIGTAWMMIFWMALRNIKYDFLPDGHVTQRYAWYLYYIPLIFISLLMFLSVLYIGRPYDCPISRRWNLLYIPSVALVMGVLTNDYHQLAFYFPKGLAGWYDNSYIHGVVYYGVVAWMSILFIAMLVIAFKRCAVPAKRKKIWIPMIPLFIGITFTICVISKRNMILTEMFTLPEMGCFVFAAFMECLILAGLFPSNDNYGNFWNVSSIGAGIMDEEGNIRYRSAHSIAVTKEQVQRGAYQEVFLEDGNIVLRSHKIKGGFGYWTKDISEINQLNRQLAELGNVLEEENAMLDAENKIAAERTRVRQQNALYDSIAKSVRPKLDKIDRLLEMSLEEKFEETMKYACILNAYIKRYSNLLLLFHQKKQIDSNELRLAFAESLEYTELYGIKSYLSYQGGGSMQGEYLLLIYKIFESALESAIPGANAVLVNLEVSDNTVSFQMEINDPREVLDGKILCEEIEKEGGIWSIETEGQTEYIRCQWNGITLT